MNYRKTTVKRRRTGETQSQGNSTSGESILRPNVRRNLANAKEALKY